jgi:hypothetical protein
MTEHTHSCIRCKAVWKCERKSMSVQSQRACPYQRRSICDKCMKIIEGQVSTTVNVHSRPHLGRSVMRPFEKTGGIVK